MKKKEEENENQCKEVAEQSSSSSLASCRFLIAYLILCSRRSPTHILYIKDFYIKSVAWTGNAQMCFASDMLPVGPKVMLKTEQKLNAA